MELPDRDRYTLLIDADLYCFSTAIALQEENPFDEDAPPLYDADQGQMVFDSRMRKLMQMFNTHKIVMCFSCNRKVNWRRTLVDSYKMNREGKISPIGLTSLMAYAMDNYKYVLEPKLEADDLLGIFSTNGDYGDTILCSWDKDMLTIPTTIWNSNKEVLKKQSKADALKFFIYQIIVGDSADGYKGIKGAGPKAAMKLITENHNKLANIWEPLLELAEKKKHDSEYLLGQARMAHILQHGDYDFDTEAIKLWEPEMIQEML
jgi:5'-3' exonuclease